MTELTGSTRSQPATGTSRTLTLVGLVAPLIFFIVLEVVRYRWEGEDLRDLLAWDRLLFLGIILALITAYALVMFRWLGRSRERILDQNRQLAAITAVTDAAQGELDLDRIVDVALTSVLDSTGAARASISETRNGVAKVTTRRQVGGKADESRAIEIPLTTHGLTMGTMKIVPAEGSGPRLNIDTLEAIGHHVADALRLGEFVEDLHRRRDEGHAFYDVLLQISNRVHAGTILSSVAQHARESLASDVAVVTLTDQAARSVQLAGEVATPAPMPTWISSGPLGGENPGPAIIDRDGIDAAMTDPRWASHASAPLNGPTGHLGSLWVGRRSATPLSDRDRGFLYTLAELGAIAVSNAQLREADDQRTVVAERERIAREMHDSLAQVLGVIHLRLRALEARPEVCAASPVSSEVSALADIAHEAYRDVREAILGLGEFGRGETILEDNLRTFLRRYSEQSGIATAYRSELGHPLALSPRCEVQLLRVVQEALTNVRKHAGATKATVTISEDEASTTVTIADDGAGMDLDQRRGQGYGMRTMSDRLTLLGGKLTIDSAPGRGTRVIATVPERSPWTYDPKR